MGTHVYLLLFGGAAVPQGWARPWLATAPVQKAAHRCGQFPALPLHGAAAPPDPKPAPPARHLSGGSAAPRAPRQAPPARRMH
eukprot:6894119-Alexandrium_andersonii.AAC.1